nr:hypothetical protein [Kofleriaceae bacterium]
MIPLALASLSLSCSDGTPNPCPNGCDVGGATVVKYTLNAYPELGFDSDTCNDFGTGVQMHVVVTKTDDATVTSTQDIDCGNGQATFSALAQGTYNVEITPMDAGGNPLTSGPAKGTVPAAPLNGRSEVTVNVTYDLWTNSYTGKYLFQLTWGGQPCATATPPITTQLLTLSRMGTPLAVMTHNGMQNVNGTDPKACESAFDYIDNLPFGPITLAVVGKDVGNVVRYQKSFDSFVGVGTFNPTLAYDLPPPDAPPPDAAPDAPYGPEAGP